MAHVNEHKKLQVDISLEEMHLRWSKVSRLIKRKPQYLHLLLVHV